MLFEFDNFIKNANLTNKKSTTLTNVDEGFIRGNMFNNLYDPYKNYEVKKLNAKNEKELLLLNIYKTCFAMNDLNLYLDINPNDEMMYDTFKKYKDAYNKYVNEYEEKYGALELSHESFEKYTWYKNPWPWEGTYV